MRPGKSRRTDVVGGASSLPPIAEPPATGNPPSEASTPAYAGIRGLITDAYQPEPDGESE